MSFSAWCRNFYMCVGRRTHKHTHRTAYLYFTTLHNIPPNSHPMYHQEYTRSMKVKFITMNWTMKNFVKILNMHKWWNGACSCTQYYEKSENSRENKGYGHVVSGGTTTWAWSEKNKIIRQRSFKGFVLVPVCGSSVVIRAHGCGFDPSRFINLFLLNLLEIYNFTFWGI